MRRRNLMACLVVAVALLLSATVAEQAGAAGYWNMPGTHAQRSGHGFGGGYHAPLILGPVRCDGWGLGGPVRVPHSPLPYYGCGSCDDCGRIVEAPSSMENFVPTAAPAPTPTPAFAPAAAAPVEKPAVEPALATPSDNASAEPERVVAPTDITTVEPVRPLFDAPVQP